MAKSTLELAVDTGKWDAGLKKGANSLNNFIEHAGGLQKALQDDSEKMRKFVGMMGNFESTAKTAKGQMNDYKSTIEQLTMQYNRMTDAQKKSIGTTYMSSIEQLKDKYHAVNEEIQKMNQSLGQTSKLDMGGGFGDKMSGALSVFGGNLMTKGFMVAAGAVQSFASEVNDAVRQGIELARQGEGIRIAFERLGRGDILQGLREATHGTVTDLELMKAAVKFNDFKLPVEELGTMLAFAQQKAKDTGQSVDYMVDSIVTGLGRKSLMILDNLGLSAAEIKDKMKETGDMTKAVGEIIRDQMAKAGDYVETAADRAQQAQVSLQNKMEELGRKFAPLEEASNQFWTSMKLGILNVIGGPLTQLLNGLTEAGRMMNSYNGMGGGDKVSRMLGNLRGANDKRGLYTQQVENYWRAINPREQYLKDRDAWMKGDRSESLKQRINEGRDRFGVDDSKIRADVAALKKQLQEYQAGAKGILNPVKPVSDTSNTGKDVADTLKNTLSKQEQAEEMVKDALLAYSQTIEKAKMEMESGYRSEADVKKANLSAQERLYDAYGKAYATYADPKYKEAQDAAAEEIKKLGGEVKATTEAQKAAEQAARQQEAAAKKLADAQSNLADALESGDLKQIYAAQKGVEKAQQGVVNAGGTVINTPAAVEVPVGIKYTTGNMEAFIGHLKEELSEQEVGSDIFNKITENLNDASAIGEILSTALQNGISEMPFDPTALLKRIMNKEDIQDSEIQGYVETLNEQLKAKLDETEWPNEVIKFNADTKAIENAAKELETKAKKVQKAWGLVDATASNLEDVFKELGAEDAAAAMTVIKAIAQIVMSFSNAALQASGMGPWAWLAWTAAGTAALATTVSTIHSITGYANGGIVDGRGGGIVPGNNLSGDLVPAMLNSQEVVLNHAQVGNLASELAGNPLGNLRLETVVGAEDLIFVLNNNGERRGYGNFIND